MLRSTLVIATLLLSFSALANDPLAGLPESVTKIHQALIANDTCMKDLQDSNEIVDFKNGTKLYLVRCGQYAYNTSARGYLVTTGGDVTQVSVLTYNEITKGVEGSVDLMNMNYDAKTGALSTFAKSRGLGDCGGSSVSKVMVDKALEYVGVKTTEVRHKEECDGKIDAWPVVFKQK